MLNGFSPKEIEVRNQIAKLIEAKEFEQARKLSKEFIESSQRRKSHRRHLLKQTVKFWISTMNQDKETI